MVALTPAAAVPDPAALGSDIADRDLKLLSVGRDTDAHNDRHGAANTRNMQQQRVRNRDETDPNLK